MPDLRDRLATLLRLAARDTVMGIYGLPGDDAEWLHIADALLASEEWHARAAVVEAVTILTSCLRSDGRWIPGINRRAAVDPVHVALTRLAAVRGKEPDNATDRPT